jgi:DNA polymerase III subunit epsilon
VGDAVLVGHNVRFDTAFLDVALRATGRPGLSHTCVDTLTLARRLLPDEVPDRRLSTLAGYFQAATPPTHRALDDALATGEVLHGLLARAAPLGVQTLDDLLVQARDRRFEGHGRARRAYARLKRTARRFLRPRRRAPRRGPRARSGG